MPSISQSARPQKRTRLPASALFIPAGQGILTEDGAEAVLTESQRRCARCNTYKPVTDFNRADDWACNDCRRAYMRARHCAEQSRDRDLRKNYGISSADYDTLADQQGGVCACCGQPETAFDTRAGRTRYLAVDHDHATGAIRALLCSGCNQALGHLKEDPARIARLLTYAERIAGRKTA